MSVEITDYNLFVEFVDRIFSRHRSWCLSGLWTGFTHGTDHGVCWGFVGCELHKNPGRRASAGYIVRPVLPQAVAPAQ